MSNDAANGEVYRTLRKAIPNLSQEKVEEHTGIPKNTIGEIEGGKKIPDPNEVLSLSKEYKSKRLCHWYCAKECEVGRNIGLIEIDPLQKENFGQVMMTIHSAIRGLSAINLDELIDISKDGKIEENELATYKTIKENLGELAKAYGELLRIEEDDPEGNIICNYDTKRK